MKILKIINNNAVFTTDDDDNEIIAMGSGIGWNTKVGKEVDRNKIEKIFVVKDESYKQIERILKRVEPKYIKLSEQIFSKVARNITVDETFILALADHISFAVKSYEKKMTSPNLILHEIKLLYPKEYKIGEYAVNLINHELNVELSDDEKGYIALHILNSGVMGQNEDANMIAILTHDITEIIKDECGETIDETGFDYMRLLTHIKYLVKRIKGDEQNKLINADNVLPILLEGNIKIKRTLNRIVIHIKNKFDYKLSTADQVYLVMHILKIIE